MKPHRRSLHYIFMPVMYFKQWMERVLKSMKFGNKGTLIYLNVCAFCHDLKSPCFLPLTATMVATLTSHYSWHGIASDRVEVLAAVVDVGTLVTRDEDSSVVCGCGSGTVCHTLQSSKPVNYSRYSFKRRCMGNLLFRLFYSSAECRAAI